jgi:dipeptide/tripeptide permease
LQVFYEILKAFNKFQEALRVKKKEKNTNPREHWLDYAENTFGRKLVLETRILLNVLVLYLPLPFFWALFDQQGSRWTFQATRMNGDIGIYVIKPDQMQVINPLLILIFIPLYEVAFYPLLNLIGIRRPLQKITAGIFVVYYSSSLLLITFFLFRWNPSWHFIHYQCCEFKITFFTSFLFKRKI